MAKAQSVYDEPEIETEVSATGFEIDNDVELGARTRFAARAAKYPFDQLQVGQSFHVAATADMPKPGTTLAGAVTNANTKWSKDHPTKTESKVLSVFHTDEAGKRVKNEAGQYIKIGENPVTRPVRVVERHFTIRSVDGTDPRGAGARVFRDL